MAKKDIRVTCAQIQSKTYDIPANIKKMKDFINKTTDVYPDTDIVVFPEYALTGCENTLEQIQEIAEPLDGDSIKEMAAFGKERGIYLVFGFIELDAVDNKIYNSIVLIDKNGQVLGKYRKMHLVEEEKELVSSGNSNYEVYDTEIGKIGMMICWDSAFVETARLLTLKGADFILVPAAWETPMQKDWDLVMRARAFDNVTYLACCNQVGHDNYLSFFGKSKIIGPTGNIMSNVVENEEAIVSAKFNYEDKIPLRKGYYALLKDRRPETYKDILIDYKGWE